MADLPLRFLIPSPGVCSQTRAAIRQAHAQKIHSPGHRQLQPAADQVQLRPFTFRAQRRQSRFTFPMTICFFHATFFPERPTRPYRAGARRRVCWR